MESNVQKVDAEIVLNDLAAIKEKVNFSGYTREDGRKLILSLINEIEMLRTKATILDSQLKCYGKIEKKEG